MKKKILSMFLAVVLSASFFAFVGCGAKDDRIEIVVDGGGVSGNFNSSVSMTPSPANPYPYNTLEKLANEYNAANTKYKVKINRNSMNGNRNSILGYLSTSTGPDIIYQTGSTIAEDMGKDYYVDMTDYLSMPNKYVEGNAKWSDLYDAQELEATRAPDGNFYSIGLDRNVAGIMVNKKLLEQAGVDWQINTYGDYIRAQDKLQIYKEANNLDNMFPYMAVDDWYDIVLEGNLYGGTMEDIDVIRKNGVLDSEELARAVTQQKYKLKNGNNPDPRYNAYLKLIKRNSIYLPESAAGYSATAEFIKGNVAMVSCLGKDMIKAFRDGGRKDRFEMEVVGYPYVTQDDLNTYKAKTDDGEPAVTAEVLIEDKGVRRGVSGIGTGWWITNSAMKKKAVDGAVDFLQFVTAPQNNGRMINDLGTTLPLDMTANGANVNAIYSPLVQQYNEDAKKDFYVWHVHNTWGIMGFAYWSKFVSELKNVVSGKTAIRDAINNIDGVLQSQVASLIEMNSKTGAWDTEKWATL